MRNGASTVGALGLVAACAAAAGWSATLFGLDVESLQAIGGLPPHVVGTFEEPAGFERAGDGTAFVFDRRRHTVYAIAKDGGTPKVVADIGGEDGRILQPSGFDVTADGRFVVTDLPRARQRIQTFDKAGARLGGFDLPGQPVARIVIGDRMLNGASTVQLRDRTLVVSHPESGALITEYSYAGYPIASVGSLRTTGFERDHDVHIAMNAGLPLVDPTGGYYFVFAAGRPVFRKYDDRGMLVFERIMQGREMDALLERQPTSWPTRQILDRHVPVVTPLVRAAAVSQRGELWVALASGVTYVFDSSGDKTRTVQFVGAGVVNPTSLSFAPSGRLLVTPGCYEFDVSRR